MGMATGTRDGYEPIDRFALVGGPYRAPLARPGDWLFDERDGRVEVGGYTVAPIPWPRRKKTGRHSPILCGDLVHAVRIESAQAVAHHWGVGMTTVWAWRKTLDVEAINPGTARLYREYRPIKLPEDVAARGREAGRRPESRIKISNAKRGKPMHPRTRAALLAACKRPKSKAWKKKHSEMMRQQWATEVRTGTWTHEMDRIFRFEALPDREKAAILGVSVHALRSRRMTLKRRIRRVMKAQAWKALIQTWTKRHGRNKFSDSPLGHRGTVGWPGLVLDDVAELPDDITAIE